MTTLVQGKSPEQLKRMLAVINALLEEIKCQPAPRQ